MTQPLITKTKLVNVVTLSEAKRHLRITNNNDDDYINQIIDAATEMAENYIGKDITKKTCVASIYDFASSYFEIQEGNFASITSLVNDSSVSITPKETYAYYNYFGVELNDSVTSDPLTVTYISGFESAQCPVLIKQAILIKIADLYDIERTSYEFSNNRNNKVFERILDPYKIVLF